MSIILMAYPAGFLISPANAKNEKVKIAEPANSKSAKIAMKNLRFIRVLTNMDYSELRHSMMYVEGWNETSPCVYRFENGLEVRWKVQGRSCQAILSGCKNAKNLQKYGEEYFKKLDDAAGRNVRVIKSHEYFYYNYDTEYETMDEIAEQLKNQDANNVYASSKSEISAEIEGQNLRYYKEENRPNFMLELESRISIVNIGFQEDLSGSGNITDESLRALKIQTNIRPDELKTLNEAAGYTFFRGNLQTLLKTSNATLNWYLQDGTYVAEFSGPNAKVLKSEAETIFRKLNKAAGRDLRYINQKAKVIYTYNTNYTDKGLLINTLTEHGATEITEIDDKISCKLFDMDMSYYKKDLYGAYILDITRVSSIEECQNVMDDLNEQYGLNVQEMTYNKIKERLANENMHLEDETVLDDNSIVLTIDVGQ